MTNLIVMRYTFNSERYGMTMATDDKMTNAMGKQELPFD